MGLLDGLLGDSYDDPRTAGLLGLAQSLQTAPNFGQGLTGGLLARQQLVAEAKKRQMAEQLMNLQVQQQQRNAQEQQRQDAFRASIPSPQMAGAQSALAGGGGPTPANAARMPAVDPNAQLMHGALQAGLIDPVAYINSQRKDTAPIKLGAGEGLFDPKTFKPIALNPKDEPRPSAIKEYEFAKAQGFPGTFQEFILQQKRAGASSVSVSMDKGFGDAFAKDAAGSLATSRDKARGAATTLQSLDRAEKAINSGKVITGPTSSVQTLLTQVGQEIGLGGKDSAEVLANTRNLMQSASSLAVDGAQALAGQGQITDGERKLVNKMAGGEIDKMTVPEIRATIATLKKINKSRITSHQDMLKNVDPKFKAFVPFYSVDMPQTDTSGEWSITPK